MTDEPARPFHRSRNLGTQTGGGAGRGDGSDHERRIQALELATGASTAAMKALETSQSGLRKDLFGDPKRRDKGGAGAFARIEDLLAESQAETLVKIDAVQASVNARWTAEDGSVTTRMSRRWQFLTYLAVGLVVAGASFGLSLIHH